MKKGKAIRSRPAPKERWTITLTYKGPRRPLLDEVLRTFAKVAGTREIGSGYDFVRQVRDFEWYAIQASHAAEFAKELTSTFRGVRVRTRKETP